MADEWKRAEVLLEEISKDVKAVAEGHSIQFRKIETEVGSRRKEFGEQFSDIKKILKGHPGTLKEHGDTLNEIKRDLKEHLCQPVPPAHVSV